MNCTTPHWGVFAFVYSDEVLCKKCREVVIVIIPVGPPSERVGERSMREDTKTQIICISVTDI